LIGGGAYYYAERNDVKERDRWRKSDVLSGRAKLQLSLKILAALNTPFSEWGNILYNTTIATAIADRLVENSEIFLLGGESFRKSNKDQPPKE